jgi:hypothetical protein
MAPSDQGWTLIVKAERGPARGTAFVILGTAAVDVALRPLPQGFLAGESARYLAVSIRNTSASAFAADLVLDVSDNGRDALARHGVHVSEYWSPDELRATGQEAFDRAVSIPTLDVGRDATVYFPVEAVRATAGSPEVEFELSQASLPAAHVAADHRVTSVVSTGAAESEGRSGERGAGSPRPAEVGDSVNVATAVVW